MTGSREPGRVDELLDRAISALNEGDVAAAHGLANEVLAAESGNLDAGDLLAAQSRPDGELRRLTVMFCDLVGSTELSARMEPEAYRAIVVRYQEACRSIVEGRYEGAIMAFRGDGVLAAFGFPVAHENDVDRAVLSGLDLVEEMERLGAALEDEGHERLQIRVAVHKGLVYLERGSRELYGLAVNVASRLEGLAAVGTVLVSDEVRRLLGDRFDLEPHAARAVKGVDAPIATHTVLGRRSGRGVPVTRAPLVGRQAELDLLRAAWDRARSGERGSGECVVVIGEAGIGKSRLVEALAHEARVDGAAVLTLSGSPFHSDVGLWPVRSLLEQTLELTRWVDGPERLRRLGALVDERGLPPDSVPLLAALLGLDPEATGYAPEQLDARVLRDRISDAALAFVTSGFGREGAVVVVEDLHWFDEEARDLVARLQREPRGDLLLLVTSRDRNTPRGERVVVVPIEPMVSGDRVRLVRELVGDVLADGEVATLAERSDGVPLYLEELARAAVQPRTSPEPDGGGLESGGHRDVPEVLYEPLVARLQSAPEGLAVATVAATIGRETDHDLLIRVSDLDPDALEDALLDLLGALVLERAGTDPDRYRFRHELIRSVAYGLQPPSRRRELHGRVADALLKNDANAVDWAVVAEHYQTAGRAADAADALEQAATVARRRGALAEARLLLGRAIEVVAASSPPVGAEREVELRLARGFLAVSLEGNASAEAAADYERCLELALPLGDTDGLFSTLNALWSYFAARGDLDRADELLDVLDGIQGARAPIAKVLATGGRATTTSYRGDLREGLRLVEEAWRLWEELGPEAEGAYAWAWQVPLDARASVASALGSTRAMSGDPSGLPEAWALGRRLCEALPFPQGPFTLAGTLTFVVWLSCEFGDLATAEEAVAEVSEIAARHGFDQWTVVGMAQREVVQALRRLEDGGADPSALAAHAAAVGGYVSMMKMVDQWVFVTYYQTLQGVLHAAAGEVDAARAAFVDSLEIGARTGMRFYDAETLRHLALLEEDPIERIAGLRAALDLAREQGIAHYELRAAVDLHAITGDLEPVATAVGRVSPSVTYPALEAARTLLAPTSESGEMPPM